MKKNETGILTFNKDTLRRLNRDQLNSIDSNELGKVTGGFSVRCPDCQLSSTNNAQS